MLIRLRVVIIIGWCVNFFAIGLCYKANRNAVEKRSRMTGKIIEGVEVPIQMYPHVALITLREMVECGGSIISNRILLTAAHCFSDIKGRVPDLKDYAVFLGSSQVLKGAKYQICTVVLHERFKNNDLAYYAYDVAVVLLRKQIIFGSTIKKIDIAPNTRWRKQNQYLAIAGFGATANNGDTSMKLKATRMQYVRSDLCNSSQTDDGDNMIVVDHMFCMISNHWTSDCFGDSGSGVIWKHKYIVGIVALGRATYCASDSIPSMYTDVVYFKNWINDKVQQLESQTSDKICPKVVDQSTDKKKIKFTSVDADKKKRKPKRTKPPRQREKAN